MIYQQIKIQNQNLYFKMKKINKKIVPLKYLIRFTIYPTIEDLLYEIVNYLEIENRMDGEFNVAEVINKTKTRIGKDVEEDLQTLISKGFIEKLKYTKYKIIKHLWEIQ